jgi:signal transduction histidine kinase
MFKRTLLVLIISLLSISAIPLSLYMESLSNPSDLRVQKGIMDLSAWDYTSNPVIELHGDWEFYWDRLLGPEDFRRPDADLPVFDTYMQVPAAWNGRKLPDRADPLPAHGVATYRMKLTHVPMQGVFALKKTNIRFSSTVYANGSKLFDDGQPAAHPAQYEPGNVPRIGFFSSDGSEIEIIVQVANYDYVNAGIPISLYFGEQAALLEMHHKHVASENVPFVILGALGIIFLICYFIAAYYGTIDKTQLTFAILCLLFATYNGLNGERPILVYLPDAPFVVMFKLKDIFSAASLIALFVLFYQLNPKILSLRMTRWLSVIMFGFILSIVFLDIPDYEQIQYYIVLLYELILLWLLLRTAYEFISGDSSGRSKTFLLFLAILFCNLYSADLILFALSLRERPWLGQICFIAFCFIMMSLIVHRLFEAYHTIKRMKNELVKMDKIKDEFLSNTSHELKTPLNAIVSITDSLLKGVEGTLNDRQAYNLDLVMNSGKRLTYLVNELLDYAKMKYGDIVLHKNSVALKPLVDSVIRIHSFLLADKPVALINHISCSFPEVYADANRLNQIFYNLIGNAIKFTERGSVEISAEIASDQVVVIHVKDSGIGIPEHMQKRIFEPFEHADDEEAVRHAGTGLGLSITRKLVELHGGTIQVESRPGEGSTFTFTLMTSGKASVHLPTQTEPTPLTQRDQRHVPAAYPVYVPGSNDETILVVDDEFVNLQAMINLLKLHGYPLIVVNRGHMALEELDRNPHLFLVILDITMPDLSGYEVLQQIRKRFTSFELPVLMLTARNRETDIQMSLDNGANDFVAKPFEAEELLARVRNLTRLKASVKQARETEISFLRSQINPHFLYNALNAIASLCAINPARAEELTLQLSLYLRGSFDFKQLDALTTLERELELVQAYVSIEKARFGNRLHVVYDIDADLQLSIPPLVLQPIVENAIKHGLMTKLEGGTVRIAVKAHPGNVVQFTISDDGCGISEQKLNEIRQADGNNKGVGLKNIGQRLKLIYGIHLHIDSKEGSGTQVTFAIPAMP